MQYVKIHTYENGNERVIYPYNLGRIRRDFPNTSFPKDIADRPETLEKFGIFRVEPAPRPEYSSIIEKLSRSVEKQEDGTWKEVWTVEPRGLDETEARSRIRQDILSRVPRPQQPIEQQIGTLASCIKALLPQLENEYDATGKMGELASMQEKIEPLAAAHEAAEQILAELESMTVEEAARYDVDKDRRLNMTRADEVPEP